MTSTIPGAINALYALVNSHFDSAVVDVLDGPSIEDVGQDVVAIGISIDEAATDADMEIKGLYTYRETFDLVCMVRSWTGDADLAARRARAFQMYEEVAEIVRGNPTLQGVVARARVVGISYLPSRLPEGAVASVTFRVRIEAFTS